MTAAPVQTDDPLGEALHHLRVTGAFYCRSELTAPWGLSMPNWPDSMWFHIVTSGRLELVVDGTERVMQAGDLALVPHGNGHVLRSEPGVLTPDVVTLEHEFHNRYAILRHGGGGAVTTLICGAVRLDHPVAHQIVPLLPGIICVEPGGGPQAEWMQSTLRLIAAEAAAVRPGGEAVLTRLSDILVIQTLRGWIEHDPAAQRGWLGALRDPQIGRAISLIHREPARDWTVAALANELAMSRSAFAARFTELVREPAMHYVTRWRMQVARHWLAEGDATVSEVAGRLGYQSEAAFSRAFKRVTGVSPGTLTRR
ncbi:MAG TPA: AraC family transcriptional regulator [Pseudonocardia sp.]|jgi:AraC-like DNA-binding protein|uniref:AraC family transcriptional regulator n=1 Tax=Pseudonocardia sp. TaxID=60912 RepID=UPI002B4B02FC|nr:AraC family transcriptional regulator [Pseudonocardia sp.]HLU54194.1 AraC family transcriptional regulator [Pseudonocardia sp.]